MTYAKLRTDLARQELTVTDQLTSDGAQLSHYDLLDAQVITEKFYFKYDECAGIEVLKLKDGRTVLIDSIDLEFYDKEVFPKL